MRVLHAWLISFRPKTLLLAISSVMVGSALAYWQHVFNVSTFLLTLVTAVLLQILSNLANDYGDAIKWADTADRIGPKRGLHSGLITLSQLFFALIINTVLCVGFGLWLLICACENRVQLVGFICIGAFSIIAALSYTIGKKPYGYMGFGDLSVLIFFGLVSVLGSFYLQAKTMPIWLLMPALGCGLLSVAVLNINNLRDYASDKANNKKTLIVLMGIKIGKYYHIGLIFFSLCCLGLFSFYCLESYWAWLFAVLLPWFYKNGLMVYKTHNQNGMKRLLVPMIQLALLTHLLYGIGIILS